MPFSVSCSLSLIGCDSFRLVSLNWSCHFCLSLLQFDWFGLLNFKLTHFSLVSYFAWVSLDSLVQSLWFCSLDFTKSLGAIFCCILYQWHCRVLFDVNWLLHWHSWLNAWFLDFKPLLNDRLSGHILWRSWWLLE